MKYEKENQIVKRLNEISDQKGINFYSMPQKEFSKWARQELAKLK